jgi:hypothetical protein
MITLSQGLADLSKELGESTTNTSARRIQHYNDAIQEFANERKWPFLVKSNTALTTGTGVAHTAISIAAITDIRMPGGIKEITITGYDDPFLPIPYADRLVESSRNRFYITPDEQNIKFTKELEPSKAITMWYYYIPARIEDTTDVVGFPIPTRYRKALGTLGAAFVQWSRYLDGQGNRLLNVYNRLLAKIETNQSESNSGTPKTIPNPMAWRGPLRRYRNGSRSN